MINDQFNRPLRDLRISVIDRCNFRCTYCMPSEKYSHKYKFLDKEEWLRFDEIVRLVRIFIKLGVKKVRLTGGEPLLRPHLHELVKELKSLGGIEDLALTTNGSLLGEQAKRLYDAGLDRLTVSVDSLDDQVSRQMNGERAHIETILSGINAAQQAGFRSIKINVVVHKGVNDHTLLDCVRYFKMRGHSVRFIEYMDVGNQNHWEEQYVVPSAEILNMIEREFPLKPVPENYRGEVAERYAFADGTGEVGFISSVTQPFCGDCTRLRLSADGKMYTCLFASKSTDLRQPLHAGASDDDLQKIITQTWQSRRDRYSELRSQTRQQKQQVEKVEMFQVGG